MIENEKHQFACGGRERAGGQPRHAVLAATFALATTISISLVAHSGSAPLESAREGAASFSSSLPRVALPEGFFHRWCGRDGAFLMRDGGQFRLYAWDGAKTSSIALKSPTSGSELQCDEAGDNLVLNARTADSLDISVFNLKTRTETVLLRTKGKHAFAAALASPNGRFVAYQASQINLADATAAADVKLIAVSGDALRWSGDSSMVLSTRGPEVTGKTTRNDYAQSIEVVHAASGQIVSGLLPRGYMLQNLFDDAFFVNNGAELLLRLKYFDSDEPGGTIFRCRLSAFVCQPVMSVSASSSMNENGDIAMSRTVESVRSQPGAGKKHVTQLVRLNQAREVDVADFDPDVQPAIKISPNGHLVVASWPVAGAGCQTRSQPCVKGVIFDLGTK